MPSYEFRCPDGHVSGALRRMSQSAEPILCHCGKMAERIMSIPHCVPDGMYSYAPNVGSADAFEQRQIKMRNGERTFQKLE